MSSEGKEFDHKDYDEMFDRYGTNRVKDRDFDAILEAYTLDKADSVQVVINRGKSDITKEDVKDFGNNRRQAIERQKAKKRLPRQGTSGEKSPPRK